MRALKSVPKLRIFGFSCFYFKMSDPVSKAINSAFNSLKYLTGLGDKDRYERALQNMRLAKASESSLFEDISVDCQQNFAESKNYTVKLLYPFVGKPYLRDVIQRLENARYTPEDLLALGPLEDNSKWLVTLLNKEAFVRALTSSFPIRKHTPRVFSLTKDIVSLRVHCLPVYVPMAHVAIFLSKYGVVQSVGWHFSKIKGYEGFCSSVRQVILEVDQNVTLPSVDRLHYDNETYRFLITVPGRGPVYFRCGVGHTRRECNAPYYWHCEVYTHSTECTVKRCEGAEKNGGRDEEAKRRWEGTC